MASSLLARVRRWFFGLNVFESGSSDIGVVRHERWSSRVYIVLLFVILYALVMYTGLESQTSRVTVTNPLYATFESLQLSYPDTLMCPCSNIAIEYQAFVQLQPSYHQVFFIQILIDLEELHFKLKESLLFIESSFASAYSRTHRRYQLFMYLITRLKLSQKLRLGYLYKMR
jgi:hypothetical protein